MECKKLTQLIREFDSYMLHILGISEMRWKGSDKIIMEMKNILYSGNGVDMMYIHRNEIHRNGVGMILNNEESRSLMG